MCEYWNHRVQEVQCSDGTYVRKWGMRGEGRGEFQYPRGVAVGPEGEVYVCDEDNHRVQVFE